MRVAARGTSAAQIADIPVKRVGERTLFVRDVAQVIDGVEEARSLAFVDDQPAIALDVQKQAGANTVAVADGVRGGGRRAWRRSCRPASRCRWCATTRRSSASRSKTCR